MSKHTKKQKNAITSKTSAPVTTTGLLDKMENYFSKYKKFCLLLCLFIALIFSFFLFNVNVSESSDDSVYIEVGHKYANDFFNYYYTSNAPLYCMFLALPIAVFGLNLIVLKSFSVAFFILGILLLYIALKNRIQSIILFPALLLTALNSLFLFYASQTFTETFAFALSGLFFVALFRLDDATAADGTDFKRNWGKILLLGFASFIFYLARNVAIIAPVVALVYFMFHKKYLTAIYSVLSFVFFWVLYQKIIMPLFWGDIPNHIAGQAGSIFLKDSYNPGLGQEDFWGMVTRFFENAKAYSSQFFELIGIKSATSPHSYWFFILILTFIALGAGYAIAKKQKYTIAVTLYVIACLCATCISLQTFWKQARLVMIYLPLIMVIVSYGIAMLLQTKRAKLFRWIYPAGVVILVLVNLSNTTDKARDNFPKLKKNLAGDMYYGFTPDWVNYFKMSEWAAENLDKNKVISCRKASMSFIYSQGRNFHGISGVSTEPSDSVLSPSKYQQHFIGLTGNIPQQIFYTLRPYMVAIIINGNDIYYTYDVPQLLYAEIEKSNVAFYTKQEDISTSMTKADNLYGVYPDKLLQSLKTQKVSYIIDANLRINPNQKTGGIINTIRRYMNFIEQKYPNTFRKIYQIGNNDNEPAMIYEVHYPQNFKGKSQ